MGTLEALTGFKEMLSKIVKPENIVSDPAIIEEYSRDISFIKGSRPLLLVRPESKDDVKGIVRLANESKMPLVPVSSGTPRFHGDTLPKQSGIIVDFSKMKRIFKIDSFNRCVMVEPGITYGELIPEVRKHGLRLNIPFLPRASKSVVTSYLEREPVLIPKYQYDYVDPLLTLEVVYGTGDEFRTGSASGPGDLEHLKSNMVNPWGPGSVDYYRFISGAQGTMGLVTWATVKAEVLPSTQKLYFIPVTDAQESIILMINLLRKRVVDECLTLNNTNLAAILAEDWPDDYKELKNNLPSWTVIVCIAGYQRHPKERLEIQEKQLFSICDELELKPQAQLCGAEGKEMTILEHLSNSWNKEPYWKLAYKGSCQDIFFLAPLSKTSDYIELVKEAFTKYHYPYNDLGCYLQPMVQGRGCHCDFNLPYDKSDESEVAEVKSLFLEVSENLIMDGAFFSRPYGPWADMVFSRYAEGVTALKKVKNIFDPNNILNPGMLCF
jgi:FAD/FMN-containing dehydrogenase